MKPQEDVKNMYAGNSSTSSIRLSAMRLGGCIIVMALAGCVLSAACLLLQWRWIMPKQMS